MTDPYIAANRDWWDQLPELHLGTDLYDLDGFRAGGSSLYASEIEELDVRGKDLVHLQCHIGLDTISWARLGARATGLDFSPNAVRVANRLAAELGADATFVCGDVYDAPGLLGAAFDVVYTGGGALCWLPDMHRWARVVADLLRPGGVLYLREFHPFTWTFDDTADEIRVAYPYFPDGTAHRFDAPSSYADPQAELVHTTTYEWPHPISEVVQSVLDAGLRLRSLREYPSCGYRQFRYMQRDEDGRWRIPGADLPFMYSLHATKEATA